MLSWLMLAGGADVSIDGLPGKLSPAAEISGRSESTLARPSERVFRVGGASGGGISLRTLRASEAARETLAGCDFGRTDKPRAGVPAREVSVTVLLVPFVINVNSATSPLAP